MAMKTHISKDEINELPLVLFSGEIVLISEEDQCAQALEVLNNHKVIGFDTETRPSFKKGESYNISLLQLSTEDQAFLFRLNHIPLIDNIRDLLANDSIKKCGVAVRDDIKGLRDLNDFVPSAFVELADMAKDKGLQNFGLRGLAALLLDQRISKGKKITNWEAPHLTPEQQKYAATDAWISLQIYKALCSL
jgi:ribonuclease D